MPCYAIILIEHIFYQIKVITATEKSRQMMMKNYDKLVKINLNLN